MQRSCAGDEIGGKSLRRGVESLLRIRKLRSSSEQPYSVPPEVLERRKSEWLGIAPQPRAGDDSEGQNSCPKVTLDIVRAGTRRAWTASIFKARNLLSKISLDTTEDDWCEPGHMSVLGLSSPEPPVSLRAAIHPHQAQQKLTPWATWEPWQAALSRAYRWVRVYLCPAIWLALRWTRDSVSRACRLCWSSARLMARAWWPRICAFVTAALDRAVATPKSRTAGRELLVEGVAAAEQKERRASPRDKLNAPSTVFLGFAELPEPAVTRDFSAHGVFVYANHADAVGSVLHLIVQRYEKQEISRKRYRARVVRVEKNTESTIGFAALILGCETLDKMDSLLTL